jgi:hypothetical protein
LHHHQLIKINFVYFVDWVKHSILQPIL